MDRPIPPSNFKTQDGDVREDLRRIRRYLEELNDWVAANSGNPNALTAASADLLYLKRAANDFNTFTQKATPTGSDLVLIEDAAASGAKKYATLYSVQSPLVGFNVAVDINPLHWWRGDNTVQTGGLVDTIVDNGSSPKNFTQTGAARSPTAVDGNGQTYLALDGVADFYQAGAVADWKFLNDGSPWTVALIFQRTAAIVAIEALIDTTDLTTNSTGMFAALNIVSGVQGPQAAITKSSPTNYVQVLNSFILDTTLQVVLIRHKGQSIAVSAGVTDIPVDIRMSRNGFEVSTCTNNTTPSPYANTNPSFTLTLGRRSSTAGSFSAARIYDVIVDNKCWSHRMQLGFENYAHSKGVTAI